MGIGDGVFSNEYISYWIFETLIPDSVTWIYSIYNLESSSWSFVRHSSNLTEGSSGLVSSEFDKIYLQRTEYQGLVYQVNHDEISVLCSLQPNKYNESALIGNLLISTSSAAFKTGDILHII